MSTLDVAFAVKAQNEILQAILAEVRKLSTPPVRLSDYGRGIAGFPGSIHGQTYVTLPAGAPYDHEVRRAGCWQNSPSSGEYQPVRGS